MLQPTAATFALSEVFVKLRVVAFGASAQGMTVDALGGEVRHGETLGIAVAAAITAAIPDLDRFETAIDTFHRRKLTFAIGNGV